ncbi:hypothetical protein [Flavobacterium sp.]|uniref:hypothetical protein n=1 Tax=Flavobacterium sp. TaxID=239 RepID=UPI002487CBD6|nr:hypothetical protein [Flavobacterium sp.]MDI1318172.1 hypothetical protein [Flavobacterium sp.]
MENQLRIYDYLDVLLQEHKNQQFKNFKLKYFLTDIMNILDINDAVEIQVSLDRTFAICNALHISQLANFQKIYRFDGENLQADWKISSLACYLIIINCNPTNEFVARAQLHFVMN